MPEKPSEHASWINIRFGTYLFFAISFVFIYGQLFQLPVTPIYFESDSLINVSNAIRILDGQVIYRDFFYFTPPGAEVIYASLFSIFGIKIWILNAVIVMLGMVQVGLLLFFGRQLLTGAFVYLPGAIFLVVGFRHFGIDGTYRLYSVIFVLSAAAVLMKSRTARALVAAGCLCGLSSFFAQPRGVLGLGGIGLFLLWENYTDGFNLKRLVLAGSMLAIGFIATVLVTQSYFAWQAGFENYYFSLVTFPQKYYPNDPLNNLSSYMLDLPNLRDFFSTYSTAAGVSYYLREPAQYLFYYLLIPGVYIAYIVFRKFTDFCKTDAALDRKLIMLCCVGTCLAAGVSAPTAGRFYQVAIPGMVVIAWFLGRLPKPRIVGSTLLAILVVLGFSYFIQRQSVTKYYLDTPAGRTAFFTSSVFERYHWIGEHTKPGEAIFEPFYPSFYFPFHLVNPTPLYLMRETNYTPTFQVDAVIRSLEKVPPPIIIWPSRWNKRAELRAVDNLEPLRVFVNTNYEYVTSLSSGVAQPVDHVNNVEVWRRRDVPGNTSGDAAK